jgi:hypothetical protein
MVVGSTLCIDTLYSQRFLVLISVRASINTRVTEQLKELRKLKNPVASLGTEPVTFQLETVCLNTTKLAHSSRY